MSENELLLAISDMMDIKLKPVNEKISKIEIDMNSGFDRVKREMNDIKREMSDTKRELNDTKREMNDGFTSIRKEMKDSIDDTKREMYDGFVNIRREMNDGFVNIRREMYDGFDKINIILENEIRPDIKLLAENYQPAATRYEKAVMDIEDMQNDIGILKKVVTEHSEKLQKIS